MLCRVHLLGQFMEERRRSIVALLIGVPPDNLNTPGTIFFIPFFH